MPTFILAVMLAQTPGCADSAALVKAASVRAAAFDLAGAAERFASAAAARCADAEVPAIYLRGWIAARDAYNFGGSAESLAPVRAAVAQLKAVKGSTAVAEIAAFVLQAAAAASQSERDELSFMIDYAVQLESKRFAAGVSGAPLITAHEAAGDLWLRVHRYDVARRAYVRAAEVVGKTPRVVLGLARTAQRLKDLPDACAQYQSLVAAWKTTGTEPPEIIEARAFLRDPACRGSVAPRP